MTQASFIRPGSCVLPFCHRAVLQSSHLPAQPGVLDGELFDAGGEDAVQPLLAAEVLAAVVEQPAHERQEHPALDEHHRRADHADDGWTSADAVSRRHSSSSSQQLGEEHRVLVALDRAAQEIVDRGEHLRVA